MILLDTHAWIWFVSNPEMLSNRARNRITASMKEKLYISSISTWEVALLAQRKRLFLTMEAGDWIRKSEELSFFEFIPVDNAIALRSVQLQPPFHKDPADRIIVATALTIGATIVTKDEKLLKYRHVKTVW